MFNELQDSDIRLGKLLDKKRGSIGASFLNILVRLINEQQLFDRTLLIQQLYSENTGRRQNCGH